MQQQLNHIQKLISENTLDEAITALKHLDKQFPGNLQVNNLFGNVYLRTGQAQLAAGHFETCLKLSPDNRGVQGNLILAEVGRRRISQALRYAQEVSGDLTSPLVSLVNAATLFSSLDRYEQALQLYDFILLKQFNYRVCVAAGICARELGKDSLAVMFFEQAITKANTLTPAYIEYAIMQLTRGKAGDAKRLLELSLKHSKDPASIRNLATIALLEGNLEKALSLASEALSLVKFDGPLDTIDCVLDCLSSGERPELSPLLPGDAKNRDLQSLLKFQKWHEIPALVQQCKNPTNEIYRLVTPFNLICSTMDQRNIRKYTDAFANRITTRMIDYGKTPFKAGRGKCQKIRLGYLSADFHSHATMHLMDGFFRLHDKQRFEVHCYSCGPAAPESEYWNRLQGHAHQFHDIMLMSHLDAAHKIAQDGIDILIDLKGYTAHSRMQIMALKPAPLQMTYLGYPGTTGLKEIDYNIVDPILVPPGEEAFYSEKLLRMPFTYQVNDDQHLIDEQAVTRQEYGLLENAFVMASFNASHKFEPEMLSLWARLMKASKHNVLWLLDSGDNRINLAIESNLMQQGADLRQLVWAKKEPKAKHLRRAQLADVALDTRIYNGHTTTTDMLWAGIPVVSLKGAHFPSRVSESLLSALGMQQLICSHMQEYQQVVLHLSKHPESVKAIKQIIAERRLSTPLFDTLGFTRTFETGLEKAWQRYIDGLQPEHIQLDGALYRDSANFRPADLCSLLRDQ